MTHAFSFDSSACTGCKACQIACKDKNDLPAGVLWRRVYEVAGGGWQRQGQAWTTDVFAYNLSIACNHCNHPICAGVCPTKAYDQRPDGLVILNLEKCVGCQYCSWACPYGAPQYDPAAGHMTKCNFCMDNLEQGQAPACVAACPLRVLDHGQQADLLAREGGRKQVAPLVEVEKREPNLFIRPHALAERASAQGAVSNWEEVVPRPGGRFSEAPLAVFSLLAQAAVGAFWNIELLYLAFGNPFYVLRQVFHPGGEFQASGTVAGLTLTALLATGPLLGLGVLASLLHLGTPRNAWRSLANLRHSWLSREILFAGLFGAGWAFTALWQAGGVELLRILTGWLTALLGAGLVYIMAQVYRFKTIPAWNVNRTLAGFLTSTMLLGRLFVICILAAESLGAPRGTYAAASFHGTGWSAAALLGVQLALLLTGPRTVHANLRRLRLGLVLAGIALSLALALLPAPGGTWLLLPLALLAAGEELIGRWLFYASRQRTM